jgi:DNA repair photolyase
MAPVPNPVIADVTCRTALGESRLPGYDYCLNPYVGCSHACIYCYARSYALRRGRTEEWGSYVDVKANIVDVLAREARRSLRRGVVGISTLTDAYQAIESTRCLTGRCLDILLGSGFKVAIQTKSDLVLRDIELLAKHSGDVTIGVTITTLERDLASRIEPGAAEPGRRVEVLSRMGAAGLGTWAFIGPILPHLTDDGLGDILEVAQSLRVGEVLFDKLNMRPGVWPSMAGFLERNYPELLPRYREIFFGANNFYASLKELIGAEAAARGLKYSFCWS